MAVPSTGRPVASAEVPVTGGLPLLLGLPTPGSDDGEADELRGMEAAVLRRNPGSTKPSNSSTAYRRSRLM